MAEPALTLTLDVQHPTREFRLIIAAGTSPAVKATILNGGTSFGSLTGWSAKLYHFASWQETEVVAIDHSAIVSNAITFQPSAGDFAIVGLRPASIILTGPDGQIIEWGRGSIDLRESPPTMDSAEISLKTPVNWDTKTFTGTPPWYTDQISGSVTIEEGDDSAHVDLTAMDLAAKPTRVFLSVELLSTDYIILAVASGMDADGFDIMLTADAPEAGVNIHWMLVL